MKTKESPDKYFLILFQCLIAFGLILRCDTMYITLPQGSTFQRLASGLILAGVLGSVICSRKRLSRRRLWTGFGYTAFFAVYLAVFMFVTNYNKKIIAELGIVFLAMLLCYYLTEGAMEVPGVLLRYETIITVLAVFSLICWLVFSVFRLVGWTGQAMTWWNGLDHDTPVNTWFWIYFDPQYKNLFGTEIARNCGIFVEAPIASLHYSFALLIGIFLRKKPSRIRMILLILAVISTFSATGYIVVAGACVIRFLMLLFSSSRFRELARKTRMTIYILTAVIILGILCACFLIVRNRIGGLSWNIRIEDFRATFQAWFDKPLFGNGIYNNSAVKAHFEGARATYAGYSCSNSLGNILADGGLMFGFLYIGAFVLCVIRAIRNREYEVAFFAFFIFLTFTVTVVPYEFLTMMLFIFMGAYKCRGARALQEKSA